ncbi:hypothetical protein UFOVP386_29 [uncultured Caudovirales phage]|uniref:Homeodomain phBC6A51-type domain-containing protein n=1 Tax=uncultured Caudovirales phage TaxID=2100421 RepID=A0A6J7X4A1_9CAUD|nr:hypothetical protein UFOVP386_29 [uncultured Caudovirales phage]
MKSTKSNTIKKKKDDSSSGTEFRKKAMIEALEKSLGIVTMACRSVGIDRTTHYSWMKEDEEYKNQVEELKNVALDFAESQLHQKIKGNDTSAIIFYLKTQGKGRGYIEKNEIEVKDPITIQISSKI